MASNKKTLYLKLLLDTKANKVLFAEAGKEAVDFLFSILTFPLGTIIKLLSKQSMLGSIDNLYNSVEQLDQTYILPNQSKSTLLNPNTVANNTLLLTDVDKGAQTVVEKYYKCVCLDRVDPGRYQPILFGCEQRRNYVTDKYDTKCPNCQKTMRTELTFLSSTPLADTVGTGFVKGVMTYMVMDDLTIMPMSNISSITMLNKFQVKDIGSLVEKQVELDIKQGLKLLKVSLQSKTVLTDVFLSNKYG